MIPRQNRQVTVLAQGFVQPHRVRIGDLFGFTEPELRKTALQSDEEGDKVWIYMHAVGAARWAVSAFNKPRKGLVTLLASGILFRPVKYNLFATEAF